MTVELLRYANRAKVADALTSQGYEVTRMTVNRWARGSEMPGIAQRMILALFGHDPDVEPRDDQQLARIEGGVRAIAAAVGVSTEAMDEMHARVLELERSRQQRDGPRRQARPPSRDA